MKYRTSVTIGTELQRRARAKAAQLGIPFTEYVRRLVADDLGDPKPKVDMSVLFGFVKGGPRTNVARDKDKMIGEAVWDDYLRSVGRKPRR